MNFGLLPHKHLQFIFKTACSFLVTCDAKDGNNFLKMLLPRFLRLKKRLRNRLKSLRNRLLYFDKYGLYFYEVAIFPDHHKNKSRLKPALTSAAQPLGSE